MPTVIQYLLGRLKQLGIRDIFGVPGDFAFPINNAICDDNELRWIGCCNELNAAYAADGYARINRISALSCRNSENADTEEACHSASFAG